MRKLLVKGAGTVVPRVGDPHQTYGQDPDPEKGTNAVGPTISGGSGVEEPPPPDRVS